MAPQTKRKSCFWGHDWPKWSDPESIKMWGGGWHLIQSRTCRRCNKVQKEQVL